MKHTKEYIQRKNIEEVQHSKTRKLTLHTRLILKSHMDR